MKFTGAHLQIMNKIGMHNLSFQEVLTPQPMDGFSKEDKNFLKAKNVILSGDFFPISDKCFRKNLKDRDANVQLEITPETEILICGQYPDWGLVEEARLYGIRIIFADRAGELFSRMATKLYKSSTVLSHEAIGL